MNTQGICLGGSRCFSSLATTLGHSSDKSEASYPAEDSSGAGAQEPTQSVAMTTRTLSQDKPGDAPKRALNMGEVGRFLFWDEG